MIGGPIVKEPAELESRERQCREEGREGANELREEKEGEEGEDSEQRHDSCLAYAFLAVFRG